MIINNYPIGQKCPFDETITELTKSLNLKKNNEITSPKKIKPARMNGKYLFFILESVR